MKKICLFICLILISACTYVGKERNVNIVSKKEGVANNKSFYVIYPENGTYQTLFRKKIVENKDSAKEVMKVFEKKLKEKIKNITTSASNLDLKTGFEKAKENNSDYLIQMDINNWKDSTYFMCRPYNDGSGIVKEPRQEEKDSLDIVIYIYDVKTKELINKQELVGNGCPIILLNLIPVGTNSPEGYLKELLDDWSKTI